VNTLKERIKGRKDFPTEEVEPDNYLSEAFWILKFYGKKQKIKYQLKDPCDLLM